MIDSIFRAMACVAAAGLTVPVHVQATPAPRRPARSPASRPPPTKAPRRARPRPRSPAARSTPPRRASSPAPSPRRRAAVRPTNRQLLAVLPKDLPAFKMDLRIDIPVILAGGFLSLAWVLPDIGPARCAPLCDKKDVFVVDRPTAGFYSEKWQIASDVGLYAMVAAGVIVPFAEAGFKKGWQTLLIVLEAAMVSNAINIVAALGARRPRPLLYSDKAPLDVRNEPGSSLSFFSGHVGTSVAITLSLFEALRRRRPKSPWQWVVLGLGLAISVYVGVGRIMSGNHFLTDVLTGAVVGTASGLIIPALHSRPTPPRVRPAVTGRTAGVAITLD